MCEFNKLYFTFDTICVPCGVCGVCVLKCVVYVECVYSVWYLWSVCIVCGVWCVVCVVRKVEGGRWEVVMCKVFVVTFSFFHLFGEYCIVKLGIVALHDIL